MRKYLRAAVCRWISRLISNTLQVGVSSDAISDSSRRTFIINLFCLVGVLFTAPLGLLSLFHGYWLVGSGLIGVALLYIGNHIYLRRTQNHVLSGNIILYPLYGLMLYLVYSGGVNGTGHVWIYCIPPVSLFLHGLKRGLTEVLLFTVGLIVILFFMETPFDDLNFHPDLNSRIVYSFVLITFLSTIYEYISSRFNQSLQQVSRKLELAATTDPLTGLLNRRGLAQQYEKVNYSTSNVWLLDIDYFKRINDDFGHELGDAYLKTVAQELTRFLENEQALISRWGGEEFLIILDRPSIQLNLSERLIDVLKNTVVKTNDDQAIQTTVSIGLTMMASGEGISKALGRADSALYEAKRRGRDQAIAK